MHQEKYYLLFLTVIILGFVGTNCLIFGIFSSLFSLLGVPILHIKGYSRKHIIDWSFEEIMKNVYLEFWVHNLVLF